jgi:hypothetical protein
MDGVILFAGVALLGGIYWEIMSLVHVTKDAKSGTETLGRKLDSIDSELHDIRSKLGVLDGIYDEFKQHEKNSSAARILKRLDVIESAIQSLDVPR